MAEYGAASQIVNPGESVVFTVTSVPCERGLIRHRDGTGSFLLSGWVPNKNTCRCRRNDQSAQYLVDLGSNISVPTGGTVGTISVALQIDGSTVPYSTMSVTPAAVEEPFNVSRSISVPVWRGCCETVSVVNISDQPVQFDNTSIRITRPDLAVTY